jgi:hypothetical protein
VLATVFFVALAFLVPLVFLPDAFGRAADLPVFLAWVVVAYTAFRLSELMARGEPALVQATFWLFVYLWIGLGALAQTAAQRFPIVDQEFSEGTQIHALLIILAGLVAADIGRAAVGRNRQWRPEPRTRRVLVPGRVWMLAIFGIVTTIAVSVSVGIGTRFESREVAERALFGVPPGSAPIYTLDDKAVGTIKTALIWLPAFVALYLLVYLRRTWRDAAGTRRRRLVASTGATVMLITLATVNLLGINPFSSTRTRLGGAVLSIALVAFPIRSARAFRAGVVALLVLLVVVFPNADVFRYGVQRTLDRTPLGESLVVSPDYGMFQQEMNGIVHVEENGHTLGRQTAGAVFSTVPRRIWADKPIATGDLVSRTEAINASATLWTEANVEGGIVLVVAFFLGYGALIQWLDRRYLQRDPRVPSLLGAAVPLFAAFQFLVLRGSLQPTWGELAPMAVLVFLCSRAVTRALPPPPGSELAGGPTLDLDDLGHGRGRVGQGGLGVVREPVQAPADEQEQRREPGAGRDREAEGDPLQPVRPAGDGGDRGEDGEGHDLAQRPGPGEPQTPSRLGQHPPGAE